MRGQVVTQHRPCGVLKHETISRRPDDTRQHAGAARALATGRLRRWSMWTASASPGLRPVDGVHKARDHRRIRSAELAGTAGESLTGQQRGEALSCRIGT
jgi:hypothetical protein